MMNDHDPRSSQTAELTVGAGRLSAHLKVDMTPGGLVATGALVGCILLSTAVLVWSATAVKRRHPIATALGR